MCDAHHSTHFLSLHAFSLAEMSKCLHFVSNKGHGNVLLLLMSPRFFCGFKFRRRKTPCLLTERQNRVRLRNKKEYKIKEEFKSFRLSQLGLSRFRTFSFHPAGKEHGSLSLCEAGSANSSSPWSN